MKPLSSLMVFGALLLTSCATQHQIVSTEPKFFESTHADIIVRYYSDNISRIMKPLQMEGPFLTSFDKGAVLDMAKEQQGRELAVVVLLQFNASDRVKQSWLTPLTGMGYKRVVFLKAENGRKLDGLTILENPTDDADKPKAPSEQSDATGG